MSKDLKELLALAAKPLRKPLKKLEYGSNVFQFISELDIRSSDNDAINFAVIYFRYYSWAKNNQLDPVASSTFSKDFKKKFEVKKGLRYVAFKISPAGFNLSPHHEQEAQEFVQEVRNRATQKKKNKKAVKEKLKKNSGESGSSSGDQESES